MHGAWIGRQDTRRIWLRAIRILAKYDLPALFCTYGEVLVADRLTAARIEGDQPWSATQLKVPYACGACPHYLV